MEISCALANLGAAIWPALGPSDRLRMVDLSAHAGSFFRYLDCFRGFDQILFEIG
jgi:hypothetical protein